MMKYSCHALRSSWLQLDHQALDLLKLRGTETATARQAHGFEPESRATRDPLHANMRWLVAIRRVEEQPVRPFTVNGRHRTSVALWVFGSARSGTRLLQAVAT